MRTRAILRRRAYLSRAAGLRRRWARRAPRLAVAASLRSASGQASVEVVALVPIVGAVALCVMALLAAGQARELAGHAATAGAMAILQGDDPERAARAAAPGVPESRMDIRVTGRRVRVRVRPKPPFGLPAGLLEATATADAGPSGTAHVIPGTRSPHRTSPGAGEPPAGRRRSATPTIPTRATTSPQPPAGRLPDGAST